MVARVQRRLAAIMALDIVGFSRLMEAGESEALDSWKLVRETIVDPRLAEFGGRVFKSTGDGVLVEFSSAVAAAECAASIQSAMLSSARSAPGGRHLRFRIGLNLGEIIPEADDIHGDGVNIAVRLEQIAEPGSVYLSEALYSQVKGKSDLRFREVGMRALKNLSNPVRIYQIAEALSRAGRDSAGERDLERPVEQEVRFCRSADGTMIAYAAIGQGLPLVKAANWLTHLEYDWVSPIWRPYYSKLSQEHLLVRYDQRGNGLSDRQVTNLSLDANVADLEAVVDASGLDRFALMGWSQGSAISVAYAARHPERVTHLVMHGGYAQGWRARGNPDEIKRREAMLTIMEAGWGSPNSAFHQIFSAVFVPDGNPEQIAWWTELQRHCTAPKQAVAVQDAQSRFDVTALLPKIRVPTLVTHSRDDAVTPFEAGRQLASLIPGARFVPLESRNHIIVPQEAAWSRLMDEIGAFLRRPNPSRPDTHAASV